MMLRIIFFLKSKKNKKTKELVWIETPHHFAVIFKNWLIIFFNSKCSLSRCARAVRTRVTAVICSCGYSWSWWNPSRCSSKPPPRRFEATWLEGGRRSDGRVQALKKLCITDAMILSLAPSLIFESRCFSVLDNLCQPAVSAQPASSLCRCAPARLSAVYTCADR